jgi:dimethylamine/trimethylamine dehydrogenase
MSRDPRYDILFEPVTLGPVVARNRFYQAPHCNGMGRIYPTSMAVMRGIKAEGGWSVVFTEQCDIHYTTDNPRNIRLWDEQDLNILERMTEQVHMHESLAGIMLAHNGYVTPNLISRETPLSPSGRPSFGAYPSSSRTMDKSDIKALRHWHRKSAINAKRAGYDIVMIYAAHGLGLPGHFISRQQNQRSDEYGGSLENRSRLLRELIEDTKDAIGDTCAVGVRIMVEELIGPKGITCEAEGRELIEMLGELPDYWDVNVGHWPSDSATSRFKDEGHQEAYIDFVKKVTTKPVVGVGRFTSPDAMVGQIKRGVLDMIGAARPSIADPFLPEKIRTGDIDAIRECIGCNMCITNNYLMAPIRCTQNPTMGEEWRRDWHPERVAKKTSEDTILIVGSGPAGLEAAHILGKRGYDVMLAEAKTELGGRATLESRLPGLTAWGRVRDYRLQQINKMPNVQVFLDSKMTLENVRETECSLVAIATGSRWGNTGIGKFLSNPILGHDQTHVYTPDDIMAGAVLEGSVVIYEDDHYYMASIIAEKLLAAGNQVAIVTPAASVAGFTQMTLEIEAIHKRLYKMGVQIIGHHDISNITAKHITVRSIYTGDKKILGCDNVIIVAGRTPIDALYHGLIKNSIKGQKIVSIGDCTAPSTIAAAVFAGHKLGRDLGLGLMDKAPFLREDVQLSGQYSIQSDEQDIKIAG